MSKLSKLTKVMVGTSVISLFAASNAFADGTAAGTSVDNTFTLDYQVDGTDQPTIDTGPDGANTPTSFIVDRVIDLTVASQGDETVAPGAQNEELVFTVTNGGNDTQGFSFDLVNEAGDDFDTTGLNITYYIDEGLNGVCDATDLAGAGTSYTPNSGAATTDIIADGVVCVVVDGDIPLTQLDTDTSDISLVATTLEPTTGANPGDAVTEDLDGNDDTLAENVFADGDGGTGNEVLADGQHSATATFTVNSPELVASKTVTVFNQDGLGNCDLTDTAVPGGYNVPGACVQYIIEVENQGATVAATNIDISDFVPENLRYFDAEAVGFTGGSFNQPAQNLDCVEVTATPRTTNCEVTLTGASLPAGSTATIKIHAFIQ